jgi:hypothetical protein
MTGSLHRETLWKALTLQVENARAGQIGLSRKGRVIEVRKSTRSVFGEAMGWQNPREKGNQFEKLVIEFLKSVLGESVYVGGSLSPIEGASGAWQADIIIGTGGRVESEPREVDGMKVFDETMPTPKAVLECKYAEPADSGSSFDTNLARAYRSLNDIGLKNNDLKRFVIVNREPRKGEQSRNYRKLFANIGVEFLNFNDLADRERLKVQALKIAMGP